MSENRHGVAVRAPAPPEPRSSYHLHGLDGLRAGTAAVYWTDKLIDVQVMAQAGLPAVCGIGDEAAIPAEVAGQLQARGMQEVVFLSGHAPDGKAGHAKILSRAQAMVDSGLAVSVAIFPKEVPADAGVATLFDHFNQDAAELGREIRRLPVERLVPAPRAVVVGDGRKTVGKSIGTPPALPLSSQMIWARDIPPPPEEDEDESLWASIIYPNSVHLVSGESGCGKSTFFYNLALHAAEGKEFVGHPFPRPLRILYIDLETPAKLRAQKLYRIVDEQPPDGLAYLDEANLHRDLDTVIALVKEQRFDLVIVDTISQVFDTQREDDNAEANQQMRAVRWLVQETGCGMVLVHHIGKSSEGGSRKVYKGRGASSRAAAADMVINLESAGDDLLRLEVAKNRWGGPCNTLHFRKVGEDRFEPAEALTDNGHDERMVDRAQRRIVELLGPSPGQETSRVELDKVLQGEGFSGRTVKRAFNEVLRTGHVLVRKDPADARRQLLHLRPTCNAASTTAAD